MIHNYAKKWAIKDIKNFYSEFTLQKFEDRIKEILLAYFKNNYTK